MTSMGSFKQGENVTGLLTALDWVKTHRLEIEDLFAQIVNVDSPSGHEKGLSQVRNILSDFFAKHNVATKILDQSVLMAGIVEENEEKPLLLLGHIDTVHPVGAVSSRPFTIRDGKAFGPGAGDMKGGVAIMAAVLAASKAAGTGWPLIGLLVPDEEIGSPYSRDVTSHVAKMCSAGLCLEGSRAGGTIVTRRAGARMLTIRVEGRAAHSAHPEAGANAILSMASILQSITKLNSTENGVSVNPGLINGGDAVNSVPAWCEAQICIRYKQPEVWPDVYATLLECLHDSCQAGTSAIIKSECGFPVLTENAGTAQLVELFKQASALEGMEAEVQARQGASDAANASATGIPVLCGTGAVSAHAHTDHEYAEMDSLFKRTAIILRFVDKFFTSKKL